MRVEGSSLEGRRWIKEATTLGCECVMRTGQLSAGETGPLQERFLDWRGTWHKSGTPHPFLSNLLKGDVGSLICVRCHASPKTVPTTGVCPRGGVCGSQESSDSLLTAPLGKT